MSSSIEATASISFVVVVACLLAAAGIGNAYHTVTYEVVGGTPIEMDIYEPPHPAAKNPLLIQIHGGGWSSGAKQPVPADVIHAGLQNGMVLATIDYRLTSQTGHYGSANVSFPAQIDDVRAAVQYLREHAAQYRIDASRMGCWGQSAGAHLCALAATSFAGTANALAFAILYYAPTDLQDMELDCEADAGTGYTCEINHDLPSSPESALIFCNVNAGDDCYNPGIGALRAHQNDSAGSWPYYEQLVHDANPITFVRSATVDALPSFFISAGYNDTLVPYLQSTRLADALREADMDSSKYKVDMCSCPQGCGHASEPAACWAPIDDAVYSWMGQWAN